MQKVVLISQQGSGTNLVRSLYNSHPDVYFFNEIFLNVPRSWETYKSSYETVAQFIERKFSERKESVVGFDLKYNQMTDEISKYIIDNQVIVIHLLRDPLRTYWKNVRDNEVSKKSMETYVERVREYSKQVDKTFSLFTPFHVITYEWLTGGTVIKEAGCNERVDKTLCGMIDVYKRPLMLTDDTLLSTRT